MKYPFEGWNKARSIIESLNHRVNDSIEQVFSPLRVALGEEAHQVAAGVQAERPRRPDELEAGFLGSAAALLVVAVMAARH